MLPYKILSKTNQTKYNENWDLYEGEHFNYWAGTLPSPNDPNRDTILIELQRAFISANLIRETVNRHVDALLGKEPTYILSPVNVEEPEESEAFRGTHKILSKWLHLVASSGSQDIEDDTNPVTKAVTKMLVTGRGYMRLFSRKRFATSPDAFKKISVHCPDNGQIEMIYDDEGSLEAIEYQFNDGRVERQEMNPATGVLTFYMLKTKGTSTDKAEDSFEVDLNYNWTIIEISCPTMLTPSIKQQQAAINLILTMMGRNIVQAGFLERLLLNAQMPGEYGESAEGDLKFTPDPAGWQTGAGVTNFISGLPLGDPRSPAGYTNPSAIFRDPVPVTTFIESLEAYLTRLYTEMGQGHILQQGDGALNGVSRIQLAQDFNNILNRQVSVIETALSDLYYTALAMLNVGGTPIEADISSFIVYVKLNISAHLLTPEDHSQIREDFKAGIISQYTTLAKLNIEDIEEEISRSDSERKQRMEELQTSIQEETGTTLNDA